MSFYQKLFAFALFFIASSIGINLQALDFPNPLIRLKGPFFSGNLGSNLGDYLDGDPAKCLKNLQKVKLTPYSNEPEKFYLLRALCSPRESQPAMALENIDLALRERGSSSDVLYAAALILAEAGANQEALQRFQEAIWFMSFKTTRQQDFYLDLGTLQYKTMLFNESRESLLKALTLGSNSIEARYMLADIAIKSNDRRNAIIMAREYKKLRNDFLAEETLLLSLMLLADPLFHKKDLAEAAAIASSLPKTSISKAEVGFAATKALLITAGPVAANEKLLKALESNPQDPRLKTMAEQIKTEMALDS